MARELGISETDAAHGVSALAPAILGGFKKQAQAPAGLEGLGGMLGQLGGGSLLDDVLSPEPTNVNRGNDVLGQIFGSRDVSRTVAQHASAQAGLDPGVLKKMLPMVAMMITGYLATERGAAASAATASSGGLGGMLSGLLGGRRIRRVGTRRPRVDARYEPGWQSARRSAQDGGPLSSRCLRLAVRGSQVQGRWAKVTALFCAQRSGPS
jgi:hypothetical protein